MGIRDEPVLRQIMDFPSDEVVLLMIALGEIRPVSFQDFPQARGEVLQIVCTHLYCS